MGLFDRFRKRVHEVAEETDGDAPVSYTHLRAHETV